MVKNPLLDYDGIVDGITELLRSRSIDFGIPAENVFEGVLGKLPDWPTPYVAIYVDPVSNESTLSGGVPLNTASVTFLIRTGEGVTQQESLREAVRVAKRLWVVVRSFPRLTLDTRALERSFDTGQNATVLLRGSCPFTMIDQ